MIIFLGCLAVFYLMVFAFLYNWSLDLQNIFVGLFVWVGWLLLFPCVVVQILVWSNHG